MRKTKTPSLVTLAILTTITIFAWIFFDVYRILKKPPIVDVDTKILEPITPNLDLNALNEIEKRRYFESIPSIIIPTPEPEANETTKVATTSAVPESPGTIQ